MCEGFGMIITSELKGYFTAPDYMGNCSHSKILQALGWQDNTNIHLRRFVRVQCPDWSMDTLGFDEEETLPGWAEEKTDEIRALVERALSRCAPALAEYEKAHAPAWAEYEKVRDTALAEFKKVCDTALAEAKKVCDTAWEEYEKAYAPAWAEYEKVRDTASTEFKKVYDTALAEFKKTHAAASAEYKKVRDTAWAEYEKAHAPAWAEYEKARDTALAALIASMKKVPGWVN